MLENTKNNVTKEENRIYQVTFASPYRRLLAFLVDSAIIYAIATVAIFLPVRGDIRTIVADAMGKKETTVEIDSTGKISNIENKIVERTKINSEAYLKIKQKLTERIEQNKIYSYLIFAIPILYNLLCLLVAGKTIGQSMLSLVVIASHSKDLSLMDVLSRVCIFTALRNIFLAPFSIALPVMLTKRRITAYDYISNTYVIEIK
jgi:uncharacterized RDD family membrane protein YckC